MEAGLPEKGWDVTGDGVGLPEIGWAGRKIGFFSAPLQWRPLTP